MALVDQEVIVLDSDDTSVPESSPSSSSSSSQSSSSESSSDDNHGTPSRKAKVKNQRLYSPKSNKLRLKRCRSCHQVLEDEPLASVVKSSGNAVEELKATQDSRITVDGLDDMEERQHFHLVDYSMYDKVGHLVPLDANLIEKGCQVYFCGEIRALYDEKSSGVEVVDGGPITGWWITGLFSDETKVVVGITTAMAEYYLMDPAPQYLEIMNDLNEKTRLLKLVYKLLDEVRNQDNLLAFDYKDLMERLAIEACFWGFPDFSEEALLKHGAFIIDQIMSFEGAADHDEVKVLDSPSVKRLCAYVNINLKALKDNQRSPTRRRKVEERRQAKPTAAEPTLATTTPLVHKFFKIVFGKQMKKGARKWHETCGFCGPCLRKDDCGTCNGCTDLDDVQRACEMRKCLELDIVIEEKGLGPNINDIRHRQREKSAHIDWKGPAYLTKGKRAFYEQVTVNGEDLRIGDYVHVTPEDHGTPFYVARIVLLVFDDKTKMAHVQWFCRGTDTVLGTTADSQELFAVLDCEYIQLLEVVGKIDVEYWPGPPNWSSIGGEEAAVVTPSDNISPNAYWYRLMYDPKNARFENVSPLLVMEAANNVQVDKCKTCDYFKQVKSRQFPVLIKQADKKAVKFTLKGETYAVDDAVMITPDSYEVPNRQKKGFRNTKHISAKDPLIYPEHYRKKSKTVKGNTEQTADPFHIGIIEEIYEKKDGTVMLSVRKLLRPENTQMSWEDACQLDINQLFWTEETESVKADKVEGKCYVLPRTKITKQLNFLEPHLWAERGRYRFFYEMMYDLSMQDCVPLTSEAYDYEPPSAIPDHPPLPREPLRMLDVFAGCGGLSIGLEATGIAKAKWAIENYQPAADAFSNTHPDCNVIVEDCNAVLKKAMSGGKGHKVPLRGEVELLCGGPPCQGFSIMNTFNEGEYSKFKNSLISTYLSYCDFYRPRFFILENVKNFVSFKKGHVLRLCLRALVLMGYQCTFGVLQAGNFGVPQNRKRAFLIAAAPSEVLPTFPEVEHVFQKMPMSVVLDEKQYFTNNNWSINSAPYRSMMVRDAITDLPIIKNGDQVEFQKYAKEPKSYYQRLLRWDEETSGYLRTVSDHICRKMSPLIEARMSLIPLHFGADWRDLPNDCQLLSDGTKTKTLKYRYRDHKTKRPAVCVCATGKTIQCDPLDRQENTIIPWFIPHTANRNNHWSGLYARVVMDSYFSTTTTNPMPEAKQGRVVHPEQHRVVSVRECARSQGFHDSVRFSGSVLEQHRQIGNAVPPPLGRAIGIKIREAIANNKPVVVSMED